MATADQDEVVVAGASQEVEVAESSQEVEVSGWESSSQSVEVAG